MRTDRLVAGLVALFVVLAVAYFLSSNPKPPPSLATHDSLVLERPHVDSVIAEHADSARARIKIVDVGQDAARQSAAVAAAAMHRADSLAAIATTLPAMRAAYDSLHRGYDSLGMALRREQRATSDALGASAFWQLAYLADSTARQADRRDADRLAADLKRATSRKWQDYVAVACGVGIRGAECLVGVRVPIGR